MLKSWEGYGKNWMHFVYKTDYLFRSIRVRTKTHLLQRPALHFFKFITTPNFFVFSMHHSKPRHQLSTLSDFICYFSRIYWLFWAIRPWNWKTLQMNSEKVESWHGIIISSTQHVQESWEGYAKTGCTSCTKRTISFKVSGFHPETRLLQRDFIF